jgi:hypothetical protein
VEEIGRALFATVRSLFSPLRRPSYHGAIEAGISSLSSRTEQRARRRGFAGA